jgi:hypothetical protein
MYSDSYIWAFLIKLNFQQDNCPVHTVQRVTAWFQNHNVTVSNWPSRSPNLNPIENMWGLLVNKLQQQRIICQKREKILNAVSDAWRTLHPDYFRNLCLSMPTRLTESNGALINFFFQITVFN